MKRLSGIFFLLLFFSLFASVQAQDTLSKKVSTHSATRAMYFSMVLPGSGQIYNRKYWKVPLIYGGGYLLISSAISNGKSYLDFLEAYKLRTDGNASTIDKYEGTYSDENLILIKNNYKRNRDLAIIGTTVLYLLNVVDAYVDGQLFDFNMSDDLQASLRPATQYSIGQDAKLVPSLSLTLRFK